MLENIKLLALDLDGTCLTTNLIVTPELINALKEVAEKDILVVPATGRAYETIPTEIKDIGRINYFITSCGSAIYNKEKDKTSYLYSIPSNVLKKILELFISYPIFLEFFVNEKIYILKEHVKKKELYVGEELFDLFDNEMNHVDQKELDSILETGTTTKINFRLPIGQREELIKLSHELEEIPDLTIKLQTDGTGEITQKNGNKVNGLKFLSEQLKIDPSNFMAIGDNENDLEMLKYVGYPIAMGQSEDDLKEVAYYVTDTNDNNGVSKAINKFLL